MRSFSATDSVSVLAEHHVLHLLSDPSLFCPVYVGTCCAVPRHSAALLEPQVLCRIKAAVPFTFLLLSREQLLIFYLLLCYSSAR